MSVVLSVHLAWKYFGHDSAADSCIDTLISQGGLPSRASLEAEYRQQRALDFDGVCQIIVAVYEEIREVLHMSPSGHGLPLRLVSALRRLT
jgi:hypothetical protein